MGLACIGNEVIPWLRFDMIYARSIFYAETTHVVFCQNIQNLCLISEAEYGPSGPTEQC